MQWDDLRYILAVHRGGSMAGAARLLGVSHVTVFRRVEAIEKSLAVRLFERKKQGYEATPAGLEMVEQAAKIEEQIKAVEARVWQHDCKVKGTLRITATDSFNTVVLPPIIASLCAQYPDLKVNLVMVNELVDLMKRDADIAVRATNAPPETLIGHKVAKLRSALYASESFARRYLKKPGDLSSVPWVALDDSFLGHKINRWIADNNHDTRVVLTSNSFLTMATAIKSGVGVGVISAIVAHRLGGLVQVSPAIDALDNDIWLLTHPDLREVARVATPYAMLRKEMELLAAECLAEQ